MAKKKTANARIIIYPKDIEIITGRSYRTACTLIQNIRKAFGKSKNQLITVKEFCAITGIDEDQVKEVLE